MEKRSNFSLILKIFLLAAASVLYAAVGHWLQIQVGITYEGIWQVLAFTWDCLCQVLFGAALLWAFSGKERYRRFSVVFFVCFLLVLAFSIFLLFAPMIIPINLTNGIVPKGTILLNILAGTLLFRTYFSTSKS